MFNALPWYKDVGGSKPAKRVCGRARDCHVTERRNWEGDDLVVPVIEAVSAHSDLRAAVLDAQSYKRSRIIVTR